MYSSFQEKMDTKNIFGTTKSILGWAGNCQPSCLIFRGKMVRKSEELANTLKTFYTEKINKLMSKIKKVNQDPLLLLDRLIQ